MCAGSQSPAPGGVPGHVPLGLTGHKLHFCSETPCHPRTEAPQSLWDKTWISEEGPGSFTPSGRAALPSRGLQGFGLLVDMDLESNRVAARLGGAHDGDFPRRLGWGLGAAFPRVLVWREETRLALTRVVWAGRSKKGLSGEAHGCELCAAVQSQAPGAGAG